MNIVGMKVTSVAFGEGTIIEQDEKTVAVAFQNETKRFEYPSGFDIFLTALDANIQKTLLEEIACAKQKKKDAEELTEEEAAAKKQDQKDAAHHAHQRAVNRNKARKKPAKGRR